VVRIIPHVQVYGTMTDCRRVVRCGVLGNCNSLSTSSHHNGSRSVSAPSPPRTLPPSVVISEVSATRLHPPSTTDNDESSGSSEAAAESSTQNGRRYWTTRQSSLLLSPVYEQQSESSSSSSSQGTVLGGFLTLLGAAGAGRRRPLRSTSFSNVSSCTAGTSTPAATTSTTAASDEPARTTLSTARPLRVYTRSSTDTELYRRGRPLAARPPTGSHVAVRQQFSAQHGRPAD